MSRRDGPEFFEWMGLRRVRRGGVACFEGRYYDRGHAIPGYLVPDVLGALLERELLGLADPDKSGWRRVSVTTAGEARYLALARQQWGLQAPAPAFATTPDPAGRRSSDPPRAPPGGQPDPSDEAGAVSAERLDVATGMRLLDHASVMLSP